MVGLTTSADWVTKSQWSGWWLWRSLTRDWYWWGTCLFNLILRTVAIFDLNLIIQKLVQYVVPWVRYQSTHIFYLSTMKVIKSSGDGALERQAHFHILTTGSTHDICCAHFLHLRTNVFVTLGLWGVELMIGREDGSAFSFPDFVSQCVDLTRKHDDSWLTYCYRILILSFIGENDSIVTGLGLKMDWRMWWIGSGETRIHTHPHTHTPRWRMYPPFFAL